MIKLIIDSINGIHYINQTEDKNHMIISVGHKTKYKEKTFDKIQHAFMIKTENTQEV